MTDVPKSAPTPEVKPWRVRPRTSRATRRQWRRAAGARRERAERREGDERCRTDQGRRTEAGASRRRAGARRRRRRSRPRPAPPAADAPAELRDAELVARVRAERVVRHELRRPPAARARHRGRARRRSPPARRARLGVGRRAPRARARGRPARCRPASSRRRIRPPPSRSRRRRGPRRPRAAPSPARRVRRGHADHEARRRDDAVVGAEHRGAQPADAVGTVLFPMRHGRTPVRLPREAAADPRGRTPIAPNGSPVRIYVDTISACGLTVASLGCRVSVSSRRLNPPFAPAILVPLVAFGSSWGRPGNDDYNGAMAAAPGGKEEKGTRSMRCSGSRLSSGSWL